MSVTEARQIEADVIVVGAGLAGLATARAIEAAGHSVIVVEARERSGGRILNGELGGGKAIELGGEWIGPTQDRMYALARELEIETFATFADGDNLVDLAGKRSRYSGAIPRVGPAVLVDVGLAQLQVARLARRVNTEQPWRTRGAAKLDAQTFATWMRRNMRTKAARSMLTIVGRTVWGAEPGELSLLHVLFYAKAAGGLDMLIDVEEGAQRNRIVGGSQLFTTRMESALERPVELSAPVRSIEQAGDEVVVDADGLTARARRVVVAIPPPLASRITYAPRLPGFRDQLTQRMPGGSLVKCMAVYERPFWRDDGLSGEALTDQGPATLTFDNSPSDGSPGVMLGFVGGADARAFARLEPGERRAAIVDGFVRLFGPKAATPDDYIEQDWSAEQWSRGGPTSLMSPGTWTAFGPALREPVGRIHWAGTETATAWCGYMEGAVQSGERAAAEVLSAFATSAPRR